MAFSAALRRAVATAPAALRPLLSTRRLPSPAAAPILSRFSSSAASPILSCFSSSSAAPKPNPPSNADLLKIIDVEIKCAEDTDDHDRVEEIPEMFPFKIQDDKGMKTVTLRRTFQGEEIEVTVAMPSLVTGGKDRADNNVEDGDERDNDSYLPLTVSVSKGDSTGLEFSCTAFPDDVQIDSMSVPRRNTSDEELIAYEGPDFGDLDENLQKAFQKYLQMRGITAMNTNFLHEYMINKDSREYLFWLKNLKQFMQK